MKKIFLCLCLGLFANCESLPAQERSEPSQQPKPIPTFRPAMKHELNGLKQRTPRLPLPLSDGEVTVNNGRARELYLPVEWRGDRPPANLRTDSEGSKGGSGRTFGGQSDPAFTLDSTFKVRLFWIVSRVNNCHYCLGHQELKLSRAGMLEDEIAALDCDWLSFPKSEQVAFAFTKKLSLTPYMIDPSDIKELKGHFSDTEIIELIQTVAGFNSTNRWTDSLGLPQDQAFGGAPTNLLTETSPDFLSRESTVAVMHEPDRPSLEPMQIVEKKLQECRTRIPRIKIPDRLPASDKAATLAIELGQQNFAHSLAEFPNQAQRHLQTLHGIVNFGKLPPRIKAQIFWATSRENRAWYSLGHAQKWLQTQGVSERDVDGIEGDRSLQNPQELAAVAFARKLTSNPRQITDKDIADLRALFSDHEVAEIVYLTCFTNLHNLFTESIGLPLEF